MSVRVKTPAEIAEANRLRDEAADGALVPGFVEAALSALEEYRGGRIYVPLPGCEADEAEDPDSSPPTTVRFPRRFEAAVRERFAATGWWAELARASSRFEGEPGRSRRWRAPFAMAFLSIDDHRAEVARAEAAEAERRARTDQMARKEEAAGHSGRIPEARPAPIPDPRSTPKPPKADVPELPDPLPAAGAPSWSRFWADLLGMPSPRGPEEAQP